MESNGGKEVDSVRGDGLGVFQLLVEVEEVLLGGGWGVEGGGEWIGDRSFEMK